MEKTTLKRVGVDIDAAERWQNIAQSYADGIDGTYHRHRIDVIKAMLPDVGGKRVIDFGCGEGVLARLLFALGAAEVIGIDIDPTLLAKAEDTGAQLVLGSVEKLAAIKSADLILSANVSAYFTDEQDREFYQAAERILPPGGSLVITHSNELFDLFTLNAYTANFHKTHFGHGIESLLSHPNLPKRTTFNIRENPLSYGPKLAAFRLAIKQTEFIHFHDRPPLLTNIDPDDINGQEYTDTLGWPEAERWKLMFQCSMFGVRATRI